MSYRDDLDALAARHASLQAEVDLKQRELADVRGMLAEARRVEQAANELDRAPDLLRRARRQLAVGALMVTLGSSAGVSAVALADAGPPADAEPPGTLVRIGTTRHSLEQAERSKAEHEALRAVGLIPMLDEHGRPVELKRNLRRPAWTLGPSVPAMGSPWEPSTKPTDMPLRIVIRTTPDDGEPRLYKAQQPPPLVLSPAEHER